MDFRTNRVGDLVPLIPVAQIFIAVGCTYTFGFVTGLLAMWLIR